MRKHFLLIVVFACFIPLLSFAQDVQDTTVVAAEETPEQIAMGFIETAELIMESTKALDQARDMYELAAMTDPNNVKANYMAGDYYLKTVNKGRAAEFFERVKELNENYRFDIYYKIGLGYHLGYEFDKALEYYEMYKTKLIKERNYRGNDKVTLTEVDRRIFECKNAIEFRANPTNYAIKNVGTRVNSEYWDYAPVVNADETVMIFTTRRIEDNTNSNVDQDNFAFEDIFISKKEGDKWGSARNIGEVINTEFHDSNLGLSPDGKQLFIYKDVNNGDIYVSDMISEDVWSPPRPLSNAINSEGYAEKSVSVNKENSLMFYSSDRPGGFGGLDIYVSSKDKQGNWSKSVNLGPTINTDFDDDAPFISYDGKTLYFSSKGRKGMGGHDIFKSEYDSANMVWTEPVNLGFPINTPDDDIYFVATKDGKRGYYASVREDGQGYTDIYMVTLPDHLAESTEQIANKNANTQSAVDSTSNTEVKQVENTQANQQIKPVSLIVRVEDAANGQAMDARVGLISVDERIEIPGKRISTGIYEFQVNMDENTEFMLSAEKDGFLFQNFKVPVPAAGLEAQEVKRRLEMKRLQVGVSSVLRNIYFDFDKATFTTESFNELNKLERMLYENPNISVEISGHTDNVGAADYNKRLSQLRANAVVNYLKNKGIDGRRMKAVGYGEEKPMATNDDEKDGRELNRRVEFRVTGE